MYYKTIVIVFILNCVSLPQEAYIGYNPTRLIVRFNESSALFKEIREIAVYDYSDRIEVQEIIENPLLYPFFTDNKILSIKPAKLTGYDGSLPISIGSIYFLDFSDNTALETAMKKLHLLSDFLYVEYDWIGGSGGSQVTEFFIPNDLYFYYQWGLKNTGQNIGGSIGKIGADINMDPAWDVTTGNENVIISILDSGIPLNAQEFSGRILPGYDFVNNDNDPSDDHGHGTNVSSIAAASGNNSIGIAGIDWQCKILPMKILNENNSGYYSWWISAIIMAVDSGANVLNMSVGGSSFSQGLLDAVDYAHNSGSIIVACMMNNNNQVTYYPAGFDNVISVGALNNIDMRAVPFCWGGGSNYGYHIDFVAPGDFIIGLNYMDPLLTNFWCGTSQATPMVAGLISLMLGINPDLNRQQIYEKLKTFAHDQIGNPLEDTPGWDKYYGWGRIDAGAVLNSVVPVELTSFALFSEGCNVILNWSTSTELNNLGFEVERFSNQTWTTIGFVPGFGTTTDETSYSFTDADLVEGKYSYRLRQVDFNGNYSYSSVAHVIIKSPLQYSLEQNYPNPFNPLTVINFQLAVSGRVSLKIYDIFGKEVITLFDEYKQAGTYEQEFNASKIASGFYFYQLRSGSNVQTRKMLLVK